MAILRNAMHTLVALALPMELVLLRVVIVPADDGIEVVRLPVPDLRLLLDRGKRLQSAWYSK